MDEKSGHAAPFKLNRLRTERLLKDLERLVPQYRYHYEYRNVCEFVAWVEFEGENIWEFEFPCYWGPHWVLTPEEFLRQEVTRHQVSAR